MGDLWAVFCENFGENWLHYNGTTLYKVFMGFIYPYASELLQWACSVINTLRPRQNGRRFADDTFKRIFLNEDVRISIKISLKFVPKGSINNNPALVQIMAWCRLGDKPLSEPMMVSLLTHICVTRPQWVKVGHYLTTISHSKMQTMGILIMYCSRLSKTFILYVLSMEAEVCCLS